MAEFTLPKNSKVQKGKKYPANPRALNVEANVEVHVNEQSIVSLRRYLAENPLPPEAPRER